LTPLTARALSAFMAYIGAVWLAFAVERRWSALQLHVESAALGIALVGVGALRSLGDLNRGPARTAVFVMLLTGSLTVFAVVEWVQSSVSRGRAGARIESWPAA
jgi:hypothetical protein